VLLECMHEPVGPDLGETWSGDLFVIGFTHTHTQASEPEAWLQGPFTDLIAHPAQASLASLENRLERTRLSLPPITSAKTLLCCELPDAARRAWTAWTVAGALAVRAPAPHGRACLHTGRSAASSRCAEMMCSVDNPYCGTSFHLSGDLIRSDRGADFPCACVPKRICVCEPQCCSCMSRKLIGVAWRRRCWRCG